MELGSLLGRWHQWRRHYSHERGYAYARMPAWADAADGDEDRAFERMQMEAIEREVNALPRELQLALQHVARAECLGVEVLMHPAMVSMAVRESLVARAMVELTKRLLQAGVM
jgi:hypothetical protein